MKNEGFPSEDPDREEGILPFGAEFSLSADPDAVDAASLACTANTKDVPNDDYPQWDVPGTLFDQAPDL